VSADFVYGNTRLRARLPELLTLSEIERLMTLDADALPGELSRTAYEPEIRAESARHELPDSIHRAVTRHLARTLVEIRRFYDGTAAGVVDLLLGRWDLHNLVALVRAQARRESEEAAQAALIPLGGLDPASAAEIARQTEPAAAVARVVAWRLPTPELARALAGAWDAYERDEDLGRLEARLATAAVESSLERAASLGRAADPVAALLAREADVRNLLAVLRHAEAAPGEPTDRRGLVSGGTITLDGLTAATEGEAPEAAARRVAGLPAAAPYRSALDRFGQGDSALARLEHDLEVASVALASREMRRGDPLGAAVPVGFVVLKETEARNLRLVVQAAASGHVRALADELVPM